mmetsp:Transcript_57782/g.102567  ORF Transcript_57782/g.102567 Transcript_57782/m.102567 type:complete len:524 (+) Transcript_57782:83-1654(+)|eukprot:CAMPEP_0197660976 /NCGR_PEP_ID=MMETSP1338-20131121/51175_1 /TAXON_ID=43686 ORGANISM="Pelagodinium beii, Strain RCC1491" /NCGR_SAMPLE_ID=MMETSP1338 /ASSEMBLY_ACC=CAM_ASM_000754 /LENGTH=523 /DNA_ID=CAMNT_0043238439 /DNA_START=59 /DNA_END=1630 /DNA_ORIENTATION=-
MKPSTDLVPWHLDRSYLKSGWHCGNTYSPVLPSVRQRAARPAAGDELPGAVTVEPKDLRPRSARARRDEALDPKAERVCRLIPLPRPRDISGASSVADGVFQEAVLSGDHRLAEALSRPDPIEPVGAKLERLRLSDLSWLSGEPLAKIASTFAELRELSLRGTCADDETIASMVAGCPKLELLDVGYCNITDLSCITQLQDLREFRAARCGQAVTQDLVASLSTLNKLEALDLSYSAGVTDQALTQLAAGCMRLRWLHLESCLKFGDAGLLAITDANPGIQHLSLALNADTFSDDAATQAAANLKRVRFLDFTGCPQVHRQFPFAVAKHCEYLEDLGLAGCAELRDDHVRRLLLSCLRLRRLDLAGCGRLTAAPFLEVLPHARALRRLNLTNVPAITDQAVKALYSASSAGDAGFDATAMVAALNAAAAAAAEEGSDAGSDDSREDDRGADVGDGQVGTAIAMAVPSTSASGGDRPKATSLLVIERFAQRPTDPDDLKDIIHIWRQRKSTKRGRKKKSKDKKK